jgi:hypothetical protein
MINRADAISTILTAIIVTMLVLVGLVVVMEVQTRVNTQCNNEFGENMWEWRTVNCEDVNLTRYIGNCYQCFKKEGFQ